MEIRTKLFAGIITTGVLLAISGFLLYDQISKVGRSFDEVQRQATPSIIALGELKSDFNHLVAAILAYAVHPEQMHEDEIERSKEQLQASYDRYAELETDEAASERIGDEIFSLLVIGDGMVEIAQGMPAAHDHAAAAAGADASTDHAPAAAAVVGEDHGHGTAAAATAAASGVDIEQLHATLGDFGEQADVVRSEIDKRIEANFDQMQAKQTAVLSDIASGTNLTVLLTAAVVGTVGGIGGAVTFSISKRVRQLGRVANAIAQGNLGEKIATAGSDEIARLAANFEQMRKSLVQAQEELKGRNQQLEELNAVLENANIELKKLDRLKDEFISVASHELRSPIHPILGYASMARDGIISSKEALDIIHRQAQRLQRLANDILDVSRIESGTLPYSMKKMDIHGALVSCVEAVRPSVAAGVSLETDFDSAHEDMEIAGDRERLSQVFMNLLGNSVKFTKKGKITVASRLLLSPPSADRGNGTKKIEITISDTGGGIPADVLPHLFNKFVTKKVGDDVAHGTGLGLFISKAIVEAHGGRISAYNNDTGGATFKIELPAAANTAKEEGAQTPMPQQKTAAAR